MDPMRGDGDEWGVLPPSPPTAGQPGPPGSPPATTPMVGPMAGPGSGASDRPPGRGRDVLATVLAVLAVLALFGANLAWWVSHDVYDTASVTTKAGLLITSPDTQAALTAVLEEKVVTPALSQAAGALPEPLRSLGGAVQDQTGALVDQAIAAAVASQTTGAIATRLVAAVNTQLVDGTGPIVLTPSELVDIVAPDLADNRVVKGLIDLAESSGCCNVVLAQRGDLPFVWQHVQGVRLAAVALPVAAMLLALASLLMARRRVRAALVLAVGAVGVGGITLLALWAGIRWGVDLIGDPGQRSTALVRQAIRITSDVTIGDLRRQSWIIVAAGAAATVALTLVMLGRRRTGPPTAA